MRSRIAMPRSATGTAKDEACVSSSNIRSRVNISACALASSPGRVREIHRDSVLQRQWTRLGGGNGERMTDETLSFILHALHRGAGSSRPFRVEGTRLVGKVFAFPPLVSSFFEVLLEIFAYFRKKFCSKFRILSFFPALDLVDQKGSFLLLLPFLARFPLLDLIRGL